MYRGSRRPSRGYYGSSYSSSRRSYDDAPRRSGYSSYLDTAAAANVILSALMKQSHDRGFKRRYDSRDSYDRGGMYKRPRYSSRGSYYRGRGRGSYSYQKPKSGEGEEEEEQKEKEKEYKYWCHICRNGTDVEKEHLEHLEDKGHQLKISRKKESYVRQIQAVVFKLRDIESEGGYGRKEFCIICNVGFFGSPGRHNNSRLHKDMRNLKSSSCRYCDLQFNERIEYDEHLLTVKHIETKAKAIQEGKEISMDDMQVLDSVGDEDEENEDLSFPEEYDETKAVGLQVVDSVTGYFCKICVTYFTKDSCDVKTHCKTKEHFEKFVEYAKIRKEEIKKQKEMQSEVDAEDATATEDAAEDKDDENGDGDDQVGDDVEMNDDEAANELDEAGEEEYEDAEETTEVNGHE